MQRIAPNTGTLEIGSSVFTQDIPQAHLALFGADKESSPFVHSIRTLARFLSYLQLMRMALPKKGTHRNYCLLKLCDQPSVPFNRAHLQTVWNGGEEVPMAEIAANVILQKKLKVLEGNTTIRINVDGVAELLRRIRHNKLNRGEDEQAGALRRCLHESEGEAAIRQKAELSTMTPQNVSGCLQKMIDATFEAYARLMDLPITTALGNVSHPPDKLVGSFQLPDDQRLTVRMLVHLAASNPGWHRALPMFSDMLPSPESTGKPELIVDPRHLQNLVAEALKRDNQNTLRAQGSPFAGVLEHLSKRI